MIYYLFLILIFFTKNKIILAYKTCHDFKKKNKKKKTKKKKKKRKSISKNEARDFEEQ